VVPCLEYGAFEAVANSCDELFLDCVLGIAGEEERCVVARPGEPEPQHDGDVVQVVVDDLRGRPQDLRGKLGSPVEREAVRDAPRVGRWLAARIDLSARRLEEATVGGLGAQAIGELARFGLVEARIVRTG